MINFREYIKESYKDLDEKLSDASYLGNYDTVAYLLDSGADENYKNSDGWTPLMYASRNGYAEIAKLLLERGADVNITNKVGCTSLIFASMKSHKRTVEILLEYCADISCIDKLYSSENSCLDYTCRGVWKKEYTQELIITGQPHNIKFFDDKIGILPSLKKKYKEVIEMSELGIFG